MIPHALVVGGTRDPNITALLAAFERARVAARLLAVSGDSTFAWSPGQPLRIDGKDVAPASVFVRHDVFGPDGDAARGAASLAWTTALVGWLLATPSVRTPNRAMWSVAPSKAHALVLAAELGLRIPATLVTNDREAAREFLGDRPKIAKPIAGGDLARPLEDAIAMATRADGPFAAPAIIQERLVPPEVRVYVVGDRMFAFEVRSPHLDYRATNEAVVHALPAIPDEISGPLLTLARTLGLDFCAADFKAGADGALRFLEVNSAPMFSRFDLACDGALTRALVEWLRPSPRETT